MWIALWLGCMSAPGDSGWGTPPVWSGTQIGEEGDDCGMDVASLDDADPAWVDAVRAVLADAPVGALTSTWQGTETAQLSWTHQGLSYLVPDDPTCGQPRLEARIELHLDAPPLLTWTGRGTAWFQTDAAWIEAEGDAWSGRMDPGQLPQDAGALALHALSTDPSVQTVDLSWRLMRDDGREESPAGAWTATP